jgi:hypothetical protein
MFRTGCVGVLADLPHPAGLEAWKVVDGKKHVFFNGDSFGTLEPNAWVSQHLLKLLRAS